MDKRYRNISLIILAITLVLSAVCLLTLPEEIVVHWNESGEANGWMSKYTAVAISTAACGICLWAWGIMRTKYEVWFAWKRSLRVVTDGIWVFLSCLGIIVNIVFLLAN